MPCNTCSAAPRDPTAAPSRARPGDGPAAQRLTLVTLPLAEATLDGWLFPGQSRVPQYLNRPFSRFGVTISELQSTARFRLAGAVPAKVFADMFDFSVGTFESYARLAGCTRGGYPMLRSLS